MPLLVNSPWHDADLASARGDNTGTIRPDQARLRLAQDLRDTHHVEHRNTFGNADHQRHLGIDGFQNGIGRIGRRHEDDRSVGAGRFHTIRYGVEHRPFQMFGATLARRNSAHNRCAVFDHLLRMRGAFAPRQPLHQNSGFFADQDAHRAPPASATTFCAPSFMPSAMVKFKPLSRRICWPLSTFVPSMRTTMGTLTCKSLAAATTPVASTSQRRMPPKMLINTAFTPGSLSKIRN